MDDTETPINFHGKTEDEVIEVLKQKISPDYVFNWYVRPYFVKEDQPDWLLGRKLTRQLYDERKLFVAAQRNLMKEAVRQTEEVLQNG